MRQGKSKSGARPRPKRRKIREIRVPRVIPHEIRREKIDLTRLTRKPLPRGKTIIAGEFDKANSMRMYFYSGERATHNVDAFYVPSNNVKTLIINKFSDPEATESPWLLSRLLVFAKNNGFKKVMGMAYPKTPEAEMYQRFHFNSQEESEGARGVDMHYIFTIALDNCTI